MSLHKTVPRIGSIRGVERKRRFPREKLPNGFKEKDLCKKAEGLEYLIGRKKATEPFNKQQSPVWQIITQIMAVTFYFYFARKRSISCSTKSLVSINQFSCNEQNQSRESLILNNGIRYNGWCRTFKGKIWRQPPRRWWRHGKARDGDFRPCQVLVLPHFLPGTLLSYNLVTAWNARSLWCHLVGAWALSMAFALTALALHLIIITRIQLWTWVFTKTASPIFPSLDLKEAWTLCFLKIDLRNLWVPHLLDQGTSWPINLSLLQTLTCWILAFLKCCVHELLHGEQPTVRAEFPLGLSIICKIGSLKQQFSTGGCKKF